MIIAAAVCAFDHYKLETRKNYLIFNHNINIINIHQSRNLINKRYLLELQSRPDFTIKYYLIDISKSQKFTETYSLKSLTDTHIQYSKLTGDFKFDRVIQFTEFPQDIKVKLLKDNVVYNLSKYKKFFHRFYEQIDFYKKHIDNPDIYLPPVVKSIMSEVIYSLVFDSIRESDEMKLAALVEPYKIWNVQFQTKFIHEEANKNLINLFKIFTNSITFDSFNKTAYGKFVKTIDTYRKLDLHTNQPELQDMFYHFYENFSENKQMYNAMIEVIIEKLKEHIMYV